MALGEVGDRSVELVVLTQVLGNRDRIPRAGVGPGQGSATDAGMEAGGDWPERWRDGQMGSRWGSSQPCAEEPEHGHHREAVRNGQTTYRVRYRDPAGVQRSKVFARKADTQRFLNETETAKARGTWTDPSLGKVLFRDRLGEWWATTTNLRPKTRDRDESLLRRLALPSFGTVPLAAMSQRDVRA
jgi:hypothetical protein